MFKKTLAFAVDKGLSDQIDLDRNGEPVASYLRRIVREHIASQKEEQLKPQCKYERVGNLIS